MKYKLSDVQKYLYQSTTYPYCYYMHLATRGFLVQDVETLPSNAIELIKIINISAREASYAQHKFQGRMESTEFQSYLDRLEHTAEIVQTYKLISKELLKLNKQLQHLLIQQKQQIPALQLCGQFSRFTNLFLKYADLNIQLRQITPNAPLCLPDFQVGPKKFTDGFMYTRQQLDNLMVWTGYMDYSRIQKWYEQRLAKVPEKRTLVELQVGCAGDRFIEMFHFFIKNRVEVEEGPALSLDADYVKMQCVKIALGTRTRTHQLDPGEISLRVQFGDYWKVPRKFAQKEVCGLTMDEKTYYMHLQQKKMEREKQEKQNQMLAELVSSRIGRRQSTAMSPPGTAAVNRSSLASSGSLGPLPPLRQKTVNDEEKEFTIRWVSNGTVKTSEAMSPKQTSTLEDNIYDKNDEELSNQYATDDFSRTYGATRNEERQNKNLPQLEPLKRTQEKKSEPSTSWKIKTTEIGVQTLEWESTGVQVEPQNVAVQSLDQGATNEQQKIRSVEKVDEQMIEIKKTVFFFDCPHFYIGALPDKKQVTQSEVQKSDSSTIKTTENQLQSYQILTQKSIETTSEVKQTKYYFDCPQFYSIAAPILIQDFSNISNIKDVETETKKETLTKFYFDCPHFYNVTPEMSTQVAYKEIITFKALRSVEEQKDEQKEEIKEEKTENIEEKVEKVSAYTNLARSIQEEKQETKQLTGYKPANFEKQIFFDIPYFYCPVNYTELKEEKKQQKEAVKNPCYFVTYDYESVSKRHERIINEILREGEKIVLDDENKAISVQKVKQTQQLTQQTNYAPCFDLPHFYCYYSKQQTKKIDSMNIIAQAIQEKKEEENKQQEEAKQEKVNAYQILASQ